MSIGLFNVQGLSLGTKRDQLLSDLSSHQIAVCCLQESKCADGFDEIHGGYRLLGLPSELRHYGLGFAVTNWLAKRVTRFWSVSDRVAVIQFRMSGKSDSHDSDQHVHVATNIEEQEELFCNLAAVTTAHRASTLLHIAGDFNSKLGKRHIQKIFMGRHSCGRRNANGSALAHFLDMHGLFACNTAFDHPARHKTTWQEQRRDVATNQVVPTYLQHD